MRRELFLHFAFWFSFFVFITLFKRYFDFSFWPFWLGGIVGIFLPDVDHLIYAYFLNPQELTSQRVNYLLNKHEVKRIISLLYETRSERKGLIFHTIYFQIIFLILTFWMLSSSGSLFGKGLVLSFSLHLLIDQVVDLRELRNLDNWQKGLPVYLDFKRSTLYWLGLLLVVLLFGFLL